jgi:hypothetical protein
MRYERPSALRRLRIRLRLLHGNLRDRALRRRPLPGSIAASEFRVYSQHREDGIVDFVLGLAGLQGGGFVEFGFAPHECNCLNLAVNRGWSGLFIDASRVKCDDARHLLGRICGRRADIVEEHLTTANIGAVLGRAPSTVEVLSIDVDGNDYWLWQAISHEPALVVIEYNASLGPERSVSVPYRPDFDRYAMHPSGLYHGASLKALERLGRRKGYRLVGVERTGVNAFFVRGDVAAATLPAVDAAAAFRPHRGRTTYRGMSVEEQMATVAGLPFMEID